MEGQGKVSVYTGKKGLHDFQKLQGLGENIAREKIALLV